MMDYARQRAAEMLRTARATVLATDGLAGVHASEFPCEAIDLILYLLLPRTSDHLFNLERDARVALVSNRWELSGKANIVPADSFPPDLALLKEPAMEWSALVRVRPSRMQVRREGGWGVSETIDLEPA